MRCVSYFYPRPPRGGRRELKERWAVDSHFYPRPPRGGRPQSAYNDRNPHMKFLSTPSARRATPPGKYDALPVRISIHALREEGDQGIRHVRAVHVYFYPRPPRGGRPDHAACKTGRFLFLSTPSARRATRRGWQLRRAGRISIHALREEGDLAGDSTRRSLKNFYPRPPRGGRHAVHLQGRL